MGWEREWRMLGRVPKVRAEEVMVMVLWGVGGGGGILRTVAGFVVIIWGGLFCFLWDGRR